MRRNVPLTAKVGLSPSPLSPGSSSLSRNGWGITGRSGIRPVSAARARENRERAAMADRRWPDRRDGTVMCECGRPECNRPADDVHEILSRARGGSITDQANVKALARECHDEITFKPESELQWAYDAGLLKHSWDAAGGAA